MFQIAITTEKLSDFIPKCEGLPTLPVHTLSFYTWINISEGLVHLTFTNLIIIKVKWVNKRRSFIFKYINDIY